MRLQHIAHLLVPALLLGAGARQALQSEFPHDEPGWRVDCDDWATLRPADEDLWEKLAPVELTLEQAIAIAKRYAQDEKGYTEVRASSARALLAGKPVYEIELLTRFEDEEGQEKIQRWLVRVGITLQQVKMWLIQERLPGTPVRGSLETMPSGVMRHDVRLGDGPLVEPGTTVKVHYVTSLLDGTLVFDTYANGHPEMFLLEEAPVAGMTAGLQGARAGGKRKLVVPPELGFGYDGLGRVIPPDATLVYDVEILEVEP